jgi:hypothetical protein
MSIVKTNSGMARVVGNRFEYPEPAKSRAELRRRIDEMWERRHEIEPERTPAMKELVDSQDEYRERIRESVRMITGREPRWR